MDSAAAGDSNIRVAYELSDTGAAFTLELRNSILDIRPRLEANSDVTLRLSRSVLNQLFMQELSYGDAISQQLVEMEGSVLKLRSFGQAFDHDPGHPYLSLR
ncbi:MAG: alkyl sulfatase C-terminal domain-containing protein [Congregibacter sp.]